MPLLKISEMNAFVARLKLGGFELSDGADAVFRDHAVATFRAMRDGLELTIHRNEGRKDQNFTVLYSGHFKKPDHYYVDAVGCAEGFIMCADFNRDIRNQGASIAALLKELFEVNGTELKVDTSELRHAQLARFMLGPHQMFALYRTTGRLMESRGNFFFRAPQLSYGVTDDDEYDHDDEPTISTSFNFNNTTDLLAGLKTLFGQKFPRRYTLFADRHEVATLHPPGTFLDVAFESGLTYIAEKEVDVWRQANCQTTNELLNAEKEKVQLYALGFRSAPAKL